MATKTCVSRRTFPVAARTSVPAIIVLILAHAGKQDTGAAELGNMKVNEIITEARAGKVPDSYKEASTGLHTFSDGERTNTDYTHYRLGLALAGADGKSPVVDMDPKTFYGKRHTSHPYTKEEEEMLKQAYRTVGAKWDDLNAGNLNSEELKDTNRSSVVAPRKKNRYGV